jgi:hypothetical protein
MSESIKNKKCPLDFDIPKFLAAVLSPAARYVLALNLDAISVVQSEEYASTTMISIFLCL